MNDFPPNENQFDFLNSFSTPHSCFASWLKPALVYNTLSILRESTTIHSLIFSSRAYFRLTLPLTIYLDILLFIDYSLKFIKSESLFSVKTCPTEANNDVSVQVQTAYTKLSLSQIPVHTLFGGITISCSKSVRWRGSSKFIANSASTAATARAQSSYWVRQSQAKIWTGHRESTTVRASTMSLQKGYSLHQWCNSTWHIVSVFAASEKKGKEDLVELDFFRNLALKFERISLWTYFAL